MPLADEEADRLLAAIPEDERGRCWWFVRRDGTPVPGDGGGGVALLTYLRFTRPIGRLLNAAHASPLADAVDRLFARYRGALGNVVRDGPAPRRFP